MGFPHVFSPGPAAGVIALSANCTGYKQDGEIGVE